MYSNITLRYFITEIKKISFYVSRWSIIEIETSSKYPDIVQAYAAGLLEGSLTWQLIYHHWQNTVDAVCAERAEECRQLMRFLHENTAVVRERAELLAATDPFWHMVNWKRGFVNSTLTLVVGRGGGTVFYVL